MFCVSVLKKVNEKMLEFRVTLSFLRLMTSGVLTKDGSRAIRVYESSKKCPEAISHLDFECEKLSIQHLTPHCKDAWDVLYLHMLKSEDAETFKMQAIWMMEIVFFKME